MFKSRMADSRFLLLAILYLHSYTLLTEAAFRCVQSVTSPLYPLNFDVLFLIDASHSMCPYVEGLRSGLTDFANQLRSKSADARFSIVQFGGQPTVKLPFNTDISAVQSVLQALECNAPGQEASFEAMRKALSNISTMRRDCPPNVAAVDCQLRWRTNALKIIIHLTDEDSDLPLDPAFRSNGQNEENSFCQSNYKSTYECYSPSSQWEPSWYPATMRQLGPNLFTLFRSAALFRLSEPYLREIEATADTLTSNDVFLVSAVSLDVGTDSWSNILPVSVYNERSSYWRSLNDTIRDTDDSTIALLQFGHPLLNVHGPSYEQFRASETLQKLQNRGLGTSLQAQMLSNGGFMRVFDIDLFSGYTGFKVKAFFDQIVTNAISLQTYCNKVKREKPIDILAALPTTVVFSSTKVTPPTLTKTIDWKQPSGGLNSSSPNSLSPDLALIIGVVVGSVFAILILAGIIAYRRRGTRGMVAATSTDSLNASRANPLYAPNSYRDNQLYHTRTSNISHGNSTLASRAGRRSLTAQEKGIRGSGPSQTSLNRDFT